MPASLEKSSSSAPAEKRRVLLLQGIMGPFFRHLGAGLRAAGHEVFKVNLNGGDRVYWRLPNGIDYRGSLEEWPAALAEILAQNAITDVMLFGDCRDHHLAARAVCSAAGVRIWVFEEGYIRPDWVTMELGGVNGHSTLPSDPQYYRDQAAKLPPLPEHRKVPSSFRRRASEGFIYNAADIFSRWYYKGWRTHRPWHPLVEGAGWARKLNRGKERRDQAAELLARLQDPEKAYFLFPLQLDSDAQIRLHSPFSGIMEALKLVLQSFAEYAPENVRLVVKEHPLDNGVRDWQLETSDLAAKFGIADRVDYLAWGDIEAVTDKAEGVVTINSTSGTLALAREKPVKVLGTAVYDLPELTDQQELDGFWQNPAAPDAQTFEAFRRVLIDRCLIPGGFFSKEALDKVVEHAVARFEGHPLAPD